MNVFSGGVIQAIAAGSLCFLLALCFSSLTVHWSKQFIIALLWVCVLVSFMANSLLYVMIKKGEIHQVASLFYLVPVAAAIIAYAVFSTTLDGVQLLGMLIAVLGVGLVNFKFKLPFNKKTELCHD